MGKAALLVSANEALEVVIVEIEADGTILANIELDGATTESHIHQLGIHRQMLKEAVPTTLDPGSRIEAIVHPHWKPAAFQTREGRAIALRHPGLGWLSFVFSDEDREALLSWLQSDLPMKT